jgi:hypothetical protein
MFPQGLVCVEMLKCSRNLHHDEHHKMMRPLDFGTNKNNDNIVYKLFSSSFLGIYQVKY